MKKTFLQTLLLCFGVGALSAQTTQISGFSDVNAVALSDQRTTPNKMIKNHFELGSIDMFITSQFDKVSFLGEIAYEGPGVDFERLVINYQLKDYFNITVGKFFTPIGYWNDTYEHGVLLQPTISRPEVLGDNFFESGLKMKKQIGVQFKGIIPSKYNFGYNLAITHGITDIDFMDDANTGKEVTLNLHAEPIENVKVFVSGSRDMVPKGQMAMSNAILSKNTNFQVMNFGLAYMAGAKPYEFIGEYFNVYNNMVEKKNTQGFILYAGYRINKFVPYVSYDILHYAKGEQYFIKDNSDVVTLGLRYLISPLAVIKMEYKYRQLESKGIENIAQMQFAIGF